MSKRAGRKNVSALKKVIQDNNSSAQFWMIVISWQKVVFLSFKIMHYYSYIGQPLCASPNVHVVCILHYKGSLTSTVSTCTSSTSTSFSAIGIKLVLVEFWWNCYVVKLVQVEIGYVVLTSTNFG